MVDMADRLMHLDPPKPFVSREEFVQRFDLVEWTFRKCQDYVEPERKGIPRDEKRPLPRKKFLAEVYTLVRGNWTLKTLKLLAGRVGISYSLARKWASEPDFKEGVQNLRDEYLDGYFDLFLKMLKDLQRQLKIRKKTDSELGVEAEYFYYLTLMVDLADYTWGLIVQQKAHEKIGRALRSAGDEIGYFSGFLKFLDLICYSRSRGKVKVGPDFVIKCRDELDRLIQRCHWEMCVAGYRDLPLTANTYATAQTTLTRLSTSRFCALIARGRQKEKIDTGAMTPLSTPTRYQALHLPHLVE